MTNERIVITGLGVLSPNGVGRDNYFSALAGGISGNAEISGSSNLEFGAASEARVSFDIGATGTLKLDRAGAFTGTVAGFTGYDAIDLADLVDGDQATIGYAANAGNSGGTLTLGDAAQTHDLAHRIDPLGAGVDAVEAVGAVVDAVGVLAQVGQALVLVGVALATGSVGLASLRGRRAEARGAV